MEFKALSQAKLGVYLQAWNTFIVYVGWFVLDDNNNNTNASDNDNNNDNNNN